MREGQVRALSRYLSLVENAPPGDLSLLQELPSSTCPIVGITGPPGAGKSTLLQAVIQVLVAEGARVAVLAVDPSSPFNMGALLGDRIRLANLFEDPNVFIRSVASRGALGGLSSKTMEMADVLRAFGFDYVFVETVGVGQSEIEVAGLADCTVLVLVPEAGDEVQTMKSGIMEIADVFVINKSDRPGAHGLVKAVRELSNGRIPVLKTVASTGEGGPALVEAIKQGGQTVNADRKVDLLVQKAWQLIRDGRVRDIDPAKLRTAVTHAQAQENFNLYAFVAQYLSA